MQAGAHGMDLSIDSLIISSVLAHSRSVVNLFSSGTIPITALKIPSAVALASPRHRESSGLCAVEQSAYVQASRDDEAAQ